MTTPRSSSPLNPNHSRSSSPLSSPTPGPSSSSLTFSNSFGNIGNYQSFSSAPLFPVLGITNSSSSPSSSNSKSTILSTRYSRPNKKPSLGSTSSSPLPINNDSDLFSEGTTPMEGFMWREKFTRRLKERERRKEQRNQSIDKRRGIISNSVNREMSLEEEEEEDRKAQEDDEEIFRRLVILQRKKLNHANEIGGLTEISPEFWEEELIDIHHEEKELLNRLESNNYLDISLDSLQRHQAQANTYHNEYNQNLIPDRSDVREQEEWENEAALAEEQERDFEEIQFANQVEQAYSSQVNNHHTQNQSNQKDSLNTDMGMDMDMEVDWEAFDSMDVE
ncbi:uncharacterized protein L201_001764 [Kwoniella dendrophila CBS 6074]|uniref:CCD97-like C-terminal domain-containing protein n=1 Tax=Kwoniella dendrophila CBS 6074 TaxID=1295534 RepID=A0AAX4JQS4_9TREE